MNMQSVCTKQTVVRGAPVCDMAGWVGLWFVQGTLHAFPSPHPHTGADLSASMQSDEHSNAGEQEVEEDGYVGGDINADTQRLLRGMLVHGRGREGKWDVFRVLTRTNYGQFPGQAKFDALGKGHEPVIKPLTGVLSKLKVHAEQVKARYWV